MIIPQQRYENGNFWIKRGLLMYGTTYVFCCAKNINCDSCETIYNTEIPGSEIRACQKDNNQAHV
jgi:hypothetical protein